MTNSKRDIQTKRVKLHNAVQQNNVQAIVENFGWIIANHHDSIVNIAAINRNMPILNMFLTNAKKKCAADYIARRADCVETYGNVFQDMIKHLSSKQLKHLRPGHGFFAKIINERMAVIVGKKLTKDNADYKHLLDTNIEEFEKRRSFGNHASYIEAVENGDTEKEKLLKCPLAEKAYHFFKIHKKLNIFYNQLELLDNFETRPAFNTEINLDFQLYDNCFLLEKMINYFDYQNLQLVVQKDFLQHEECTRMFQYAMQEVLHVDSRNNKSQLFQNAVRTARIFDTEKARNVFQETVLFKNLGRTQKNLINYFVNYPEARKTV